MLEVARPALWADLEAAVPLAEHIERALDDTRRVVRPSFEGLLADLRQRGVPVLVRYARRSAAEREAAGHDLAERVAALTGDARRLLHRAQRHARDGVVVGEHVWDPEHDAALVSALHGAGLIQAVVADTEPRMGRYHLHPDLPPPLDVAYDFAEAVMGETDDLSPAGPGPVALLHDLASLSAALSIHPPRRTHAGTLDRSTARKLGRRLGSQAMATEGKLEDQPRWGRALGALEALGAIEMDPVTRELHPEPGLETVLEGTTADAVDRLVHRLVEPDLQAVLPALRTALAQAGAGAVDELIFLDELHDQHRDVIFHPWLRDGAQVYPASPIPFDRDGFDAMEGKLVEEVLRIAQVLGLVRRAPGVFSPTDDGRLWAAGTDPDAAPVWVSSDLEILVPPGAVTPWERYQLERLGRCLSRDVVDRYKLERASLAKWLATHDLDEAIDLLERRCPGVPGSVRDTLREWARSATRYVLTRGVLV